MSKPQNQTIRSFIAIEIPKSVQGVLGAIQNQLGEKISPVSWVKPGNIHLTLKFIGEVRSPQLEEIKKAVERAIANHSPFSMEIGSIGAFPNLTRPRTIWAGIKTGAAEISALALTLNDELNQCGYRREKNKFNPHFTLARLKRRVNLKPFVGMLRQYNRIDGTTLDVNQVTLIQSQLHPSGAIYTPLKSFVLKS